MVDDTTVLKPCRDCGEPKPLDDFNRNHTTRDGRQPHCRLCQRARNASYYHGNNVLYQERARLWKEQNPARNRATKRAWAAKNPESVSRTHRSAWLKFKYGINVDQWEAIFAKQGGRCGICRRSELNADRKRFHVDHNHTTGKVRGILCNLCNVLLGNARDSRDTLARAIAYLEETDEGASGSQVD